MSNLTITTKNNTTQMTLFPEVKEKVPPKRRWAPVFKSYNPRQIQVTEEIEKETNPSVRKEIRKKRSQLKKSAKEIREDFIPRMAKYKEQNVAVSSLPMPKTVIADAGYGSEENDVYAVGEEKEPRFEFLIPYGSYVKEQTRKYKKDIKNAKNWKYIEEDDCFICPNGRKVTFKKYQNKKNSSGYEQSFKIYECEDCTGCPLKAHCTKAQGNRQVHWNPVFEEMKAKAKQPLNVKRKPQSTLDVKLM